MLAKDDAFERKREGDLSAALEVPGKGRRRRIRCPKCQWEPRADSLWQCTCGHAWNTFDTAALCPACGRQWQMTICLRCTRWSRHVDWYEKPGPT